MGTGYQLLVNGYWLFSQLRILFPIGVGIGIGIGIEYVEHQGRRATIQMLNIEREASLTRLLHERGIAHAISALAAETSAAKVSARCYAACSRLTLRRAERRILSKPRLVGARRSPKGGHCTSTRAMSGLRTVCGVSL